MSDSIGTRRLVLGLALGALLGGTDAGAARYKGDRIDIYTGQIRGRWIVTTTAGSGGSTLATVVRCRPRGKCRPFPRRLRLQMTRQSEYAYTGTFQLAGQTCVLDAYVYPEGFEGVYTCADQTQGSIAGRRA